MGSGAFSTQMSQQEDEEKERLRTRVAVARAKLLMKWMHVEHYPAKVYAITESLSPPGGVRSLEHWELLKRNSITIMWGPSASHPDPLPDCASHVFVDIEFQPHHIDIRMEETSEDDADWEGAYEMCECKGFADNITAMTSELDEHMREKHDHILFPDDAGSEYNYRILYSDIELVYRKKRERIQIQLLAELLPARLARSKSRIARMARNPLFEPQLLRMLFRTLYVY